MLIGLHAECTLKAWIAIKMFPPFLLFPLQITQKTDVSHLTENCLTKNTLVTMHHIIKHPAWKNGISILTYSFGQTIFKKMKEIRRYKIEINQINLE